jgi:YD repeat-containing protein
MENKRSYICLVLLTIFWLGTLVNPVMAFVNTDIFQTSSARQDLFTPESANAQNSTYLPIISAINGSLFACHELPMRILNLFNDSTIAYYPLMETSGKNIVDLSPNNRSGVYEGNPALNTVPALCENAPQFDGVDDIADVFSAGLASGFNGDEGTIIMQLKVEKEEWIDGNTAYYLSLSADPNNNIALYKSANNQLEFAYTAGGKRVSATINDIATDHWVTYTITWSKSQDRFYSYVAGELIYPAQTGLGDWAGELTTAEFAGNLNSGGNFAKSSISSVVILNREATAGEIREYSAIFGATKVLSVLGDSISRVYMSSPWSLQAIFAYDGGNKITLKSHAKSGYSILPYEDPTAVMDTLTIAAATDDADFIILALGTVDDNDDDMNALQEEVEENIAELKLSNPRARLYYMNVLPIWTDESGLEK